MSSYSELVPPTQEMSSDLSNPCFQTKIKFYSWWSSGRVSLASAFDQSIDLENVILEDMQGIWAAIGERNNPFILSIVVRTFLPTALLTITSTLAVARLPRL